MADHDTPEILVVGPRGAAVDTLESMQDLSVRCAEDYETAANVFRRIGNETVSLIVIGPDVESPLLLARRMLRLTPHAQFLILQPKERLHRLAEMLAFVPDLSGAWAVDADAGAEQIRPIVTEALEVSRARRRAAALPDKLNAMLARADAGARAEPRRQPALWQSFFSAVLSQAPDPIFATDVNGTLLTWNDAASPFFGATPDQIGDAAVPQELPPPWLETLRGLLGRAASGERIAQHEARLPRADGSWVDLSFSLAPVRDERDRVVCISFVARDVSEQKQLQNQQQLLIRELNHRVKNVLALVQSIARRTAQSTVAVEEFLKAFEGRLQAMSAAHGLLSDSRWRGASLPDVAAAVLDMHLREGRIHLDLPDVQLPPALSSSLALVLHELGTNAVKHGALSSAAGGIWLSGRLLDPGGNDNEPRLELEWREQDGPGAGNPGRSGFGTRLISQLIAYQHNGHVEMDWSEPGLTCRMTMPLAR